METNTVLDQEGPGETETTFVYESQRFFLVVTLFLKESFRLNQNVFPQTPRHRQSVLTFSCVLFPLIPKNKDCV